LSEEILRVENLVKRFPIKGGIFGREVASVKAVSDVSFSINRGETLGLVGESGCGKSTLGRCILRLQEPTAGKIFFDGRDITEINSGEMRKLRRKMQIIFQDPYSSLNPRMTVQSMLMEPLKIHGIGSNQQERKKRILDLLDVVGLRKDSLNRYPHEFSGGQRQRISIARALAVEPELIICDEPVSALDVSIQAQIINLLMDLQDEFGLTYLFIAHDLKVVEHISNRVAVMYLGKIAEIAHADELYSNPRHPYTRALLSAVPIPDPERKSRKLILEGDVPSPIYPPQGCYFHPRCPIQDGKNCVEDTPDLSSRHIGENHLVSCHYAKETPEKMQNL